MSLARKRTRRHLSITSLIDAIFLLLLFFMLASTFTKFSELDIGNTGAADPAISMPIETEVMILLVTANQVTLDGVAVANEDLVESIRHKMAKTSQLNLKVTNSATAQHLTDILVLLKPVNGLQVNMVGAK